MLKYQTERMMFLEILELSELLRSLCSSCGTSELGDNLEICYSGKASKV